MLGLSNGVKENITTRDMSIVKSHVFYYGGGDVYDRNLKGNMSSSFLKTEKEEKEGFIYEQNS